MEISSSSYNQADYYTNPQSWQATNMTSLSLNQNQGTDGQQSIKDVISDDDSDTTKQMVN